jgi:tetratricopeptide (TPR) repeat protein
VRPPPLPLALCDIAARAVARPGLPLATLLAEMRDARKRLDALETGESATSVRMVFSWSRARLGTTASRLFRLLAVHQGPDITVPTAGSLAGLPPGPTKLAVAELCDEHLLTEHVPGRFTCHELLRSYAAEEAGSREDEADLRSAVFRILDHYLHAATVASGFLYPRHHEITWTPGQTGVTLERIAGPGQAAAWFENEQHALLGVIRQAADGGYAPYAWKLPWIAGWYLQGEACWQRLADAQESALVVATGLDDLAGQVMARQHLGWLRFLLGDIASAGHHLDEAIELARQFGDNQLRALASLSRAHVLQARDRIVEAMAHARQALLFYRAAGDARGEAHALYAICWHLVQIGDHQQAAKFSSQRSWLTVNPLMTPTSCCGRNPYSLPNGCVVHAPVQSIVQPGIVVS